MKTERAFEDGEEEVSNIVTVTCHHAKIFLPADLTWRPRHIVSTCQSRHLITNDGDDAYHYRCNLITLSGREELHD